VEYRRRKAWDKVFYLIIKFMMTLQGDKDEDVVVVMASTIPPGYDLTSTPETATAFEENSAYDYR